MKVSLLFPPFKTHLTLKSFLMKARKLSVFLMQATLSSAVWAFLQFWPCPIPYTSLFPLKGLLSESKQTQFKKQCLQLYRYSDTHLLIKPANSNFLGSGHIYLGRLTLLCVKGEAVYKVGWISGRGRWGIVCNGICPWIWG